MTLTLERVTLIATRGRYNSRDISGTASHCSYEAVSPNIALLLLRREQIYQLLSPLCSLIIPQDLSKFIIISFHLHKPFKKL